MMTTSGFVQGQSDNLSRVDSYIIIDRFFSNSDVFALPEMRGLKLGKVKAFQGEMEFGFSIEQLIKQGRVRQKDVDDIKSWTETKKYPSIPEELLASFLLSCENDLKETRRTIEAYFNTRNNAPEIFSNRNIDTSDLQLCMQTVSMVAIPQRTAGGHALLFFSMEDPSYSKFNLLSILRITSMLLDAHIQEYPSKGLIVVMDMNKFTTMLLTKMNISLLTKLQRFVQEGLPMKIHEVHILNCNAFFNHIMNLFKFCISKEILSKFKLHQKINQTEFFERCIPAKCMPSDYGGELPSLRELTKMTENRIRKLHSHLKHEEKLRQLYKADFHT